MAAPMNLRSSALTETVRAPRVPSAMASLSALVSLVAWLALAVATSGCSAEPAGSEIAPAPIVDSGTGVDPCATPNQGCTCAVPAATVACGDVVQTAGTYVSCSMGTRTCSGGAWGPCVGAYVTTKEIRPASENRLALLNPATPCSANPCDPSCAAFVDTPSGLDAGVDSGITITDAAVTLTATPVPVTVCSGLQITPSTSSAKDLAVTTMVPSPNTVSFTAALLPASCYAGSLNVLWSIDKFDVAQISSAGVLTLAVPYAGPITVTAYAGALSASVVTNVTVNVVDTTVGPAPSGYSNTQFPVTTGTTDNIAILYPYTNTVFPLGLPSPLLQWSNSTTANAVKVTLRFPATGTTPIFSWSEIVPELQLLPAPSNTLPAQPRATIPQSAWNAFQQTVVRNSGTTGGDAVFAIQRYISGKLYAEVPTTIHFANGQLKGNVFYNSYGTNLVQNFKPTLVTQGAFGAATLEVATNATTPTVVVGFQDTTYSGAGCRVCHSANANGTRILTNSFLAQGTSGGANSATSFLYDPTQATPALIQSSETLVGPYSAYAFTYAALSPDGHYLLTSSAPATSSSGYSGATSLLYSLTNCTTPGVTSPCATLVSSSTLPPALAAATPAFSTDGLHVAFNFGATGFDQNQNNPSKLYFNSSATSSPLTPTVTADGKSLAMMDFAAPSTFSKFVKLYTPGTALYAAWPSFLPAGQNGIVFTNEITGDGRDWGATRTACDQPNPTYYSSSGAPYCDGTSTTTCNFHGIPCNSAGATAELWWVSTGTTPTATRLTSLNGGTYLPTLSGGANLHGTSAQNSLYYEQVYNYEPTALPVTIGGYSWVAFTSRRLYGNVATINPYWSDPRYQDLRFQPTTKKIWISAIAGNPTPGTDPSFPAFYLPGQELLAGNGRAFMSLAACEAPGPLTTATLCSSNLDCCGSASVPPTGVCQLDPPPLANPPTSHCVVPSTASCVADSGICSTDAQCCNFATGSRCASGTCQPTPTFLVYNTATFTTTYTASCASGLRPVWRFLYWQTVTPTGTSIAFTAQTSTDGINFGAAVAVGTSAPPPTVTSTFTSGPSTVDQALVAAGQASQPILQVLATLNPTSNHLQTPQLTNWQVTYDCVPAE
jgi:hypothetical protein